MLCIFVNFLSPYFEFPDFKRDQCQKWRPFLLLHVQTLTKSSVLNKNLCMKWIQQIWQHSAHDCLCGWMFSMQEMKKCESKTLALTHGGGLMCSFDLNMSCFCGFTAKTHLSHFWSWFYCTKYKMTTIP